MASKLMFALTVSSAFIVFIMVFGLYRKSKPVLEARPLIHFIFSSTWHPLKGNFGFFPFIMGTLWVTGVAVIIAVPLSLLTSIYLSEYAYKKIKEWAKPLIDLLAGIPSVVYGVWGILLIVPLVKNYIVPFLNRFSTGYCVLTAGIVLAVMIMPIIVHVTLEVFNSIPNELREASLALGATKWQTIKHVVIRKAMPGILTAVLIAFGRGIGDAAAVIFTAGYTDYIPYSLFRPAATLPLAIFYQLGTPFSEVQNRAYASAFILTILILLISIAARIITKRFTRHIIK